MGLPMYVKPEDPPRETERDPTAAARSQIRRRAHRRRLGSGDLLRRSGLDRDRRSSQQVLLDLLSFTQDNSTSSVSGPNISSAATTASSTASASSGTGSTSQPPQPVFTSSNRLQPSSRRDSAALDDYESIYSTFMGPSSLLPSVLPNGLRIIRHAPAVDPSLPSGNGERERETERERDTSNNTGNPSFNHLRFRLDLPDLYSNRLGPPYARDEEGQPSYERESARRAARAVELTDSYNQMREHMRLTVPGDLMGFASTARRRGSMVDGLGDRERSLSPDASPWSYFPTLQELAGGHDLGHPCDFLSEDSDEDDEDRATLAYRSYLRPPTNGLRLNGLGSDGALERLRLQRPGNGLLGTSLSHWGMPDLRPNRDEVSRPAAGSRRRTLDPQ